jgi:predicted metalloprotease with PDZ domain
MLRILCGLAGLLWLPWVSAAQLQHALDVVLLPETHSLEVQDTITLPAEAEGPVHFTLHPELQPQLLTPGMALSELPELDAPSAAAGIRPKHYRVELAPGQRQFTLRYTGNILHDLQRRGEEYARSFQQTQGMITPQGVFLSGASYWYPHIEAGLLQFELDVTLPADWKAMTQGARLSHAATGSRVTQQWRCHTPQEEIYLIAGPFTEYRQDGEQTQAMVLLRTPDPALAQQYLDATQQYLELYSGLLGRYPFNKFAMVENFWETGYGMPSFTLLGSKVIRFPFILHSSYPHEILHNWWGNSVYIDYQSGNWAEGLTSYLADHLIKEQQGGGVDYRRTVLQKYTDYVDRQADFPLTAFRSRHSARTEAVGYGKTLMLFHMLRRQLGDADFIRGLQALYEQYRFRVAGFKDVQRVFSATAAQPLAAFFTQWVERSGAPQLQVTAARADRHDNGYRLTAVIEQTQPEAAYTLQLPVAVHMEGVAQAHQAVIEINARRTPVELDLPARPLRLAIDPEFDVFRRLHRSEIPPAVSQAMGADQVLLVLPGQADPALLEAYRALAAGWQADRPEQVQSVIDTDLQQLPADRAVWLFGWNNRFRPRLDLALQAYDYAALDHGVRIGDSTLTPATHSVAVLARHPQHPEHALGWLAADTPAAVPGLGRKLPHYGRYSYLAFTGTAPDNVLKGQWPVVDSPLSVSVVQADGASVQFRPARLAARKALAATQTRFSLSRMQADLDFLASPDMAGRGLGTDELERSAAYIAAQFAAAGLQPGGDAGGWFQQWQEPVAELGRSVPLKNVIGILPGSDPARAEESLVIGAHYDHLGHGAYGGRSADRGQVHPGADDNASGLAVMLELARALKDKPLPRSVVFVAFSAEETGRLGSRHYVRHPGMFPLDQLVGMLNLDTVGRLGEKPLVLFGTGSADEWPHIFRGAGYVTGVAVQPVQDDFGSSDQTSFIEAGIPAVQLFGGTHADIHRPGDTLDKLDSGGLLKVAEVLYAATDYLGRRPGPLTVTLPAAQKTPAAAASGARKVSFGTVPDFTWSGGGVRLEDVRAATPAASAGLRAGDIISAVNDRPVTNMRDYAQALRVLQPGDEIRVRFRRGTHEQVVTTRVTER